VVILFSRVYDLYNLEVVFRHVTAAATQDIYDRLGLLNCVNPLKPSHNLKLNMRHMDNRIIAHTFFTMSSLENGDQLKQHPRSQVDIIALYAQLGRIIQDDSNNDNSLMFTYCEIGERQSEVAWSYRQDMCQKFLVGTKPWDPKMFKIIKMYKEIVAAKALMVGPIDLQYKEFMRNKNVKKGVRSRATGVVGKLKSETLASRSGNVTEDDSSAMYSSSDNQTQAGLSSSSAGPEWRLDDPTSLSSMPRGDDSGSVQRWHENSDVSRASRGRYFDLAIEEQEMGQQLLAERGDESHSILRGISHNKLEDDSFDLKALQRGHSEDEEGDMFDFNEPEK